MDLLRDDKNDNFMSEKMSKKALKRLIRKEKKIEKKDKLIDANLDNEVVSTLQNKYDLILEKHLEETEYYFENGLRKVFPYYFNYSANAKGRWFNKKIVDIFCSEIQGYTEERCQKITKNGLLKVNDKNVDADYIIKNGDVINNYVHRHELPVTDEKIGIMYEDESVLVVNKPSSIPMHPCGRYRHNSLLYILAKEYGYKRLFTIHRIDRLTSGLVIFCKSEYKAKKMAKCIVNRTVKKEYICKVDGIFPSDVIECTEPLGAMCAKNGVYKVDPKGKISKTVFEKLSSKENTSIVKCMPMTGRTHQIRVHLQYLGFPIVNDPLYNNSLWGVYKGKGGNFGRSDDEVIKDLMKIHSSNLYLSDDQIENIDNLQPQCIKTQVEQGRNLENSPIELTDISANYNIDILNENAILNPNKDYSSNLEFSVPFKRSKLNSDLDVLLNEKSLYPSDNKSGLSGPNICNNYTSNLLDNQKQIDNQNNLIGNSIVKVDADCIECHKVYKDPTKDQLIMYLHAVKYEGPDWSYSTPIPDWVN